MSGNFRRIRTCELSVLTATLMTVCWGATSTTARADESGTWRLGDVVIEQAWVQLNPHEERTGALYMTVHNRSDDVEYLMTADSPAARELTFQEAKNNVGEPKLSTIAGFLNLSSHGEIVMRPDGIRISLAGLTTALKPGDRLPVTLVFLEAGKLDLEVPVLSLDAKTPAIKHLGHKL